MKKEEYWIYNYKQFNKAIIGVGIFFVFMPIFIYLIRLVFPDMIRCIYYEISGNPCPFCGITTDIRNMLNGNLFAYKYNLLSVPLVIIASLEIIVRLYLINKPVLNSSNKFKKILKIDIFIHIVISSIILFYLVIFSLGYINRY